MFYNKKKLLRKYEIFLYKWNGWKMFVYYIWGSGTTPVHL